MKKQGLPWFDFVEEPEQKRGMRYITDRRHRIGQFQAIVPADTALRFLKLRTEYRKIKGGLK
jgi:hypothetical protein